MRARTHTNTTFLLPNLPHLNTISQDVGKISSLEGEKGVLLAAGWGGERHARLVSGLLCKMEAQLLGVKSCLEPLAREEGGESVL